MNKLYTKAALRKFFLWAENALDGIDVIHVGECHNKQGWILE